MTNDLRIVMTEDGSHTLFSEKFQSTYHSIHGAITESEHIFIDAGLKALSFQLDNNEPIRILETGFGTGLNAFLSLLWAEKHQRKVIYQSIENFPISIDLAKELNYCTLKELKDESCDFMKLHEAAFGKEIQINAYFSIEKKQSDFLDLIYSPSTYHLIYFDPFDYASQAELWQKKHLESLYSSLKEEGILVTYGAKGSFKRDLKAIGFEVEGIPGPPGKREITRALK